ncbi:MAG TPA: hypothetical protein VMG13_20275, partial [Trebonia sp.]|nr:hypothetical protein [Trebonia sp.]
MTSDFTDAPQPGDEPKPDDSVAPPDGQEADNGAAPDEGLAPDDGLAPGDGLPADDGPSLRAALEAILLVADEPVPEVLLAQVLERPRGEVAAGLRALA